MTKTLNDKQVSKKFFNEWIGAKGPKGWVGRFVSNTGRWYTDMLIKEAKIKPEDKILDVGCGSASTIINLLNTIDFKNPIQGIEPSNAQLALAKKNIAASGFENKAIVRQGFASPLPFDDNAFDVVYASFIIKHFSDFSLSEFFREAYRVLVTGGRFLGWEFKSTTNPVFKKISKDPAGGWYLRDYLKIKPILEKVGFSNIEKFKVKNRGFWDLVKNTGFKALKR